MPRKTHSCHHSRASHSSRNVILVVPAFTPLLSSSSPTEGVQTNRLSLSSSWKPVYSFSPVCSSFSENSEACVVLPICKPCILCHRHHPFLSARAQGCQQSSSCLQVPLHLTHVQISHEGRAHSSFTSFSESQSTFLSLVFASHFTS